MNRRYCAAVLALLVGWGICTSWAGGQTASGSGIPQNIKEAPNVRPHRPVIEKFIKERVAALANDEDPAAQSAAREAIATEISLGPFSASSPDYLDTYADLLNASLVELARNPSMRVRLNAAIVAARVAEKAENSRLRDAAALFIKDQSDPVILWGIKAARWLIPQVLRNPLIAKTDPLVQSVVDAAKANGSGPVIQEAYAALTLNFPQNRTMLNPGSLEAVIPRVQDLLESRVEDYTAGVPPEPQSDERPTLFLVDAQVWAGQKDPQKLKTVQLLSDLLCLAALQTVDANNDDSAALARLVSHLAKALNVIPVHADEAAAKQALQAALARAIIVNSRTSPQEIVASCKPVYQALRGVKAFAELKPPPTPTLGAEPVVPATTGSTQ